MKSRIKRAVQALSSAAETPRRRLLEQVALQAERDRVLDRLAERMPLNPILQGRKIRAQCDEDGILAEIFRRIGPGSRVAVEFGCGDGAENNTHALLLSGWRALWVEGDARHLAAIRAALREDPDDPVLLLAGVHVTLDRVEAIAGEARRLLPGPKARIDLLSMDLDGNDLHFLERLVSLRPRVLCCEYNAQLGPEIDATVAYDPDHVWAGDDYMGASLAALRRVLEPAGYALVCCNLSGANAFFVERAEAERFGGYAPEELFQPPRHHFILLEDYHPRRLAHLARRGGYAEAWPPSRGAG